MEYTLFIYILLFLLANHILVSYKNKITKHLLGALLFLVNTIFIILILSTFKNMLPQPDSETNTLDYTKITSYQIKSVKFIFTLVLVALIYLIFGLTVEYGKTKGFILVLIIPILIVVTVLYYILVLPFGMLLV